MPNMLLDLLPTSIEVGGNFYNIDTNFRTSIEFELLMLDEELEDEEKGIRAIALYLDDVSFINENNVKEVIDEILNFYTCGKNKNSIEDKSDNEEENNEDRIYDFEYDDMLIYAAFLSEYNIDLQDIEYLHWWKFKAMFNSLSDDCKFCKIMGYRAIDLSEIEDSKQKNFYRKMKSIYEIPTKKKMKEKERYEKIREMLEKGENPKDLL